MQRCVNPACREPRKGFRYAADAVEICFGCGEMQRNGKLVTLDDFMHFSPQLQTLVGAERQTVQEAIGHWNYLRDQGVEVIRG